MLTTLQNRTCVSYKYTDPDQKPSWKPKRFRFLMKPPDRTDLWQEFVALKQGDWVNLRRQNSYFTWTANLRQTPQQSTVARRIAQQLDLQNACLNNGQRIVNVHGALKWLLEQIGKQLGVSFLRR